MNLDENFDNQMDALPASLRNKVLDHLFPEDVRQAPVEGLPKWPLWKNLLWLTLMATSLTLSAGALLPGLFLTVVFPPVGLLILLGIGSSNAALIRWRFGNDRLNNTQEGQDGA